MPYKLLLADDSVTIQRVIELTFADEDVRVVAVGDGQQAIERIEADPPDIILADVDMPKRDGYEVAAYVKSRPKLAHIPVVLLTGAFEPIDQARANAVGSDDVLAKPFEPQMVINRVKQLLGQPVEGGGGKAAPGRPQAVAPPAGASARMAAGGAPTGVIDPVIDRPLAGPEPGGDDAGAPVSLDDYFDQLDAAFAHLHPGQPSSESAPGVGAPAAAREDLDWIPSRLQSSQTATPDEWSLRNLTREIVPANGRHLEEPPASDLAPAERVMPFERADVPARPVPPRANGASVVRPAAESRPPELQVAPAPAPAPPAAPPPPPPMADAFAALLAAEQGEPAPPIAAAGFSGGVPEITESLIDDIVARVLQRLSDRVVRESVSTLVSRVAERLVREEIERIKAQVT